MSIMMILRSSPPSPFGRKVKLALGILEYLDHRAGGEKIIPRDMTARLKGLTLQALCDGILDAGILLVYEAAGARETKRAPGFGPGALPRRGGRNR
jgi:glutathione S-transferase